MGRHGFVCLLVKWMGTPKLGKEGAKGALWEWAEGMGEEIKMKGSELGLSWP